MNVHLTVFPTAIGFVGLAWEDGKILAVQLPHGDKRATLARLNKRYPGKFSTSIKDGVIAKAKRKIQKHLAGQPQTLTDIPVQIHTTVFRQKVYQKLRQTREGTMLSYKDLAKACGFSKASRAVGSAMAKNPCPIIIPCHRVCRSDGSIGNFSAKNGISLKKKILAQEGLVFSN